MNKSIYRIVAIAAVAVAACAAAVAVRLHYESVYRKSQIAYRQYQERLEIQRRAETEARANEQKLESLRAAVAANPKSIPDRWKLAAELQKYRMLPEALADLKAIEQIDPKSQEAAVGIGNTHLALGKLKDAEAQYRKVTRKWPKCVEAWQGLAAVLYQMRHYRDAGEAGRQALSLDPNDKGSRIIVASSALEFGLEVPDDNQTRTPLHIARALFELLVKDDPEDGQLQYQLGLAMFMLHDKKGALPHLAKATEKLPDHANIAADYAQILISSGKYADARSFLGQVIQRMPKVASFEYLLAESYQYESDPNSIKIAADAARRAVELSPTTPTYWDRLGAALLKEQDIEGARKALEKSLLLNANRSYPYQQLAGIYNRMGQTKRANAAAKMATRMVANEETMRHLEALSAQYPGAENLLLIRADRYRDLKMFGPARDLYEQALQLKPDDAVAKREIEAIDKIYSAGIAGR